MYDNKISQVYDNVNITIVDIIEKKLGKLARTTDKKHTFLGFNTKFIGSRKVAIIIPHHIEEAIEDFKG